MYKIGLPGKLILRDYFQENVTSRRPFLLLFREDLFLYNCLQFFAALKTLEEDRQKADFNPVPHLNSLSELLEKVNCFLVICLGFQKWSLHRYCVLIRADGKSQVRQCLGLRTADFSSSLAYESADQNP